MSNLWVTFSTDSSGSFTELSGNIIYNLNNLYNFNGNLVDTTSDFIIYELSNNPIQGNVSLQANNWKQSNINTILNPFQGYWLGGINTNLPQIFVSLSELQREFSEWISNPIPVTNIYGLIENWDVGNIQNMSSMFNGASSFNQDISNWDVGNVTNMSNMFYEATSFDGNISNWDVGNVTNMSHMFYDATNFNRDLNQWNVGNVTDMNSMFELATSFNQDISNLDVGNVTNMNSMFLNANSFNQDISNWNVGNVTNMYKMFSGANNFNQDISNWNVGNVTNANLVGMFENVTFFTDMTNKIYSNGTPFNYFMSQRNTTISVSIRAYFLYKFTDSTGTILTLLETFSDVPDSDFDRIKNALSITSMDELTNYSFTSSQDSTSRDILSVWQTINETTGLAYYYNLSGANTNQSYYDSGGPYTLTFTRRT
jgi:surface protein